ncbi:hypothetical protein GYA19_01480 [Candidatus Beckwithbacteria bacterium]|nr:hypothetical protein [Candidatus Beckwithbacteria bacterium]
MKNRREIIAEIKKQQQKTEVQKEKILYYQQNIKLFLKKIKNLLLYSKKILLEKSESFKEQIHKNFKIYQYLQVLFVKLLKKANLFCLKIYKTLKYLFKKMGRKILHFTWHYRFYFLITFFLSSYFLNLFVLNNRLAQQPFKQEIQNLNFFPSLPSSSFDFASQSLNFGQAELAQQFLKIGKQQNQFLKKFYLNIFFEKKMQQTINLVEFIPRQKKLLAEIDQKLGKYPYSLTLLLQKAKLESELKQTSNCQQTITLVKWLNPQIEDQYLHICQ